MKNLILQFSVLFATIAAAAYFVFKIVVASYKEKAAEKSRPEKKRRPVASQTYSSSQSSTTY